MGLLFFLLFSPLIWIDEYCYGYTEKKYKNWLADIIGEAFGVNKNV